MSDGSRVAATVFVWIMVGAMTITGFVYSDNLGEAWVILPIVAMIMMAAGGSTMALWNAFPWQRSLGASAEAVESSAKAKRRGRVDHMLDDLSDEEIEQLRTRLTSDDGEQVTLEEVLRRRR